MTALIVDEESEKEERSFRRELSLRKINNQFHQKALDWKDDQH